jgi:hypothetical protein
MNTSYWQREGPPTERRHAAREGEVQRSAIAYANRERLYVRRFGCGSHIVLFEAASSVMLGSHSFAVPKSVATETALTAILNFRFHCSPNPYRE